MLRRVDFIGLFAKIQGNQNEVIKNIKSLEQCYNALDKKMNNKFEEMKADKSHPNVKDATEVNDKKKEQDEQVNALEAQNHLLLSEIKD